MDATTSNSAMCCADRLTQHGLELRRQLLARQRVDASRGPARAEQARVDRERALHLLDAGQLREARGEVLQLRHASAIERAAVGVIRRSRSCGSGPRRGSPRRACRSRRATPRASGAFARRSTRAADAGTANRRARMNATVGMSTRSGRRMTAVAIECHHPRPLWFGWKIGTRNRSMRGPRSASSAGRNVSP